MPIWSEQERDNYRWWQQRISLLCEYCDCFRVDHALGFFRQWVFPWWPEQDKEFLELTDGQLLERNDGRVPQFLPRGDNTEVDRELNSKEGREILAMMKMLANRYGGSLIAEDLGCVPDYVRPTLAELGAPGFVIPHWDSRPMSEYPTNSVGTWDTHDHPPLRVAYEERQAKLHHEDPARREEGLHEMRHWMQLLGQDVSSAPPAYTPELHEQSLTRLMESSANLVVISAPSLFGTKHRFNVPGQTSGCWTARFDRRFADYVHDPVAGKLLRRLRTLVKETGRWVF